MRLKAAQVDLRIVAKRTLAETQRALVETAKREHAAVMRTDPRPTRFQRYVDGRQGAREETVTPYGIIHYSYQRVDEVVRFAMERLFDNSPVRSGAYRSAHTIFISGVAVRNLSSWRDGDEVAISNSLIYSRKIEIGAMKMRVPGTDHVYERSMRDVRRRFGNIARVDFGWRGIQEGSVATGPAGNVSVRRFPALIIVERG